MKAWGYVRVSTDAQAASGLGLEDQRDRIVAYCNRMGYELGGIFSDPAVSGSKPFRTRAGGKALCEAAQRGDIVIVSKLDRAFRSLMDALKQVGIWKNVDGVNFAVIDFGGITFDCSTAMGKFLFTILGAVAEFERDLIGERTRAALNMSRAKGVRPGDKPPFGFKYKYLSGGTVACVPCEVTRQQILDLRAMHDQGMSIHEIVRQMKHKAIRPLTAMKVVSKNVKNGKLTVSRRRIVEKMIPWSFQSISKALKCDLSVTVAPNVPPCRPKVPVETY